MLRRGIIGAEGVNGLNHDFFLAEKGGLFDFRRKSREEEFDEDILRFIRIALETLLAESLHEIAQHGKTVLRVRDVVQAREAEVEECPEIIRFFE